MGSLSRMIRWGLLFLLSVLLTVGLANCSQSDRFQNESLMPVNALPDPSLPDWIEQISPTGTADNLAQIRIRFKAPLISVESLDSPDQKKLLQKFQLTPVLPGTFRFLTPRMVGFQADQALPKASRIQVTLKAGLSDLGNHLLAEDLSWTFNTEAIQLSGLPGKPLEGLPVGEYYDEAPIDLKPTFQINSNVALDPDNLRANLKLAPSNDLQTKVPVAVALHQAETTEVDGDQSRQRFDPNSQPWVYDLTPQRSLNKDTTYRLEISPGLRPFSGNLVSNQTYASEVKTYAPFVLKRLAAFGTPDAGGTFGRFVNGGARLQFNNPLDAESVAKNLTIEPAPTDTKAKFVDTYDGSDYADLNSYVLKPNTTYTITLGAGIKDKFGQTLGQAKKLEYKTGDVGADLWVPTGLNIFPTTNKALQLNIAAINLPEGAYQAAYRVVQPMDLVYRNSANPNDSELPDFLPQPSTWKRFNLKGAQKNKITEVSVNLRQELGQATGMLAYGVKAKTNTYVEEGQKKWREAEFYGMVQLTNLGVFAQWFPQDGLVRVNHLDDGSAVANADVEIYLSKLRSKSQSPATPCAIGKTDKTGLLKLAQQDLRQCMGSKSSFDNAPEMLVVAREGQDWAFTRTLEYSGAYRYGIYAGWDGNQVISRGEIFSDRQLYQPGETAYLTGVAYYLKDGELRQDRNQSYKLSLRTPDGQEKDLGSQISNDFGTFSLELPLASNQALGFYTLEARSANGVELRGEFRVAEFKPPNFKVELTLSEPGAGKRSQPSSDKSVPEKPAEVNPPTEDNPNLFQPVFGAGDKVQADVQSNYLFGSPVESGKVNYYITRKRTSFVPGTWQDFSFGRQWFWPEEEPIVPTDVLQAEQALDRQGRNTQLMPVSDDLPYAMIYRVDAQVSDVSNLSVADSQTFIALPSDRLIGLKGDFVGEAGKPFPINVIVTDAGGESQANQTVHVELQRMDYSQVGRIVAGSRTDQNQVEYETVDKADLKTGKSAESVSLTPTKPGAYRIRANFVNARTEVTATDIQIWVTGNDAVNWGDRYDARDRLEIKLDKETYQLGDTATALIQSPYPEAEVYFAVIRNKTLYQKVSQVTGNAPKIQFQITSDMLPNAAVEAVLVRRGKPIEQVEPGSLENLAKTGFAPFKTKLDSKYLKVSATAKPSLKPGEKQIVQLVLTDAQDKPIQGQLTVMVVNDAVLQLSGYRPPDLVKTVYAEQEISTRFSDNRPDVVVNPTASPLDKGWGYGGGESAGAANTRARKNFQPIAYYNGSVLTDAQGKAQVEFKLPDDFTTWRVMAVAIANGSPSSTPANQTIPGDRLTGETISNEANTRNWQFGQGETTFVSTQSLLANPVLPRFVRPGDRFHAGVAITNTTNQAGKATVKTTLEGNLQFEGQAATDKAQTANLNLSGTGTQLQTFKLVAGRDQQTKLQFALDLNGLGDAFEMSLPIKPLTTTEQVVEAGSSNQSVTIPLKVDQAVNNDAGGLEVSLASTLIPQIIEPSRRIFEAEPLPFLEAMSSRLNLAASLAILGKTYSQTVAEFSLAQQAEAAIVALEGLQRADGGFAFFPGGEKSDPLVSPYAAEALAKARAAGLTVDDQMIERLKSYLANILANPGQYDFCSSKTCQNPVRLGALQGLADLGDRRADFLANLYEYRNDFNALDRLKLATYLSQSPDWQSQAKAMFQQLQESAYETARSATFNLPENWRWFHSQTATQAELLKLAIGQKASPELLSRLVQGLLDQRREGTWSNLYDATQAVSALVAYSNLQPDLPNFTTTVSLAGKQLATGQFQGYQKPNLDVNVAITDLPRGQHDLKLDKRGNGLMHYLVAYRYRLQGNPPGRLNGLRVIRVVRPANQEAVLATYGLPNNETLKLPAGQVYDVGLQIITDHPVSHMVITDHLPAGLEAVDTSVQTSTPYFQAKGDSWEVDYQTIHDDRITAYGDSFSAGIYTLHYLVRSVTPGTFLWPGAEAHLQYAPEEFGRVTDALLEISRG